jgi:hypothetical protein
MKNFEVDVVFVLDMSGSMSGLKSDTIGGYNSFLLKQKELRESCFVSTILFNYSFSYLHDRVNIKDVSPLTENDYRPSGMTALYDALGYGIEKLVKLCNSTLNVERKVIFVIITDGEENSSKLFREREIKSLISDTKHNLQFEYIFLGANIASKDVGESIGIDRNYSHNYNPTSKGTRNSFKVMSNMVHKSIEKNEKVDFMMLNSLDKDDEE